MTALHIQVHVAFTYFYLNKRSGYLWTAENNSWSSFCCLWLSSGQSQFFSPISVRMNICQHLDELLTPFPSYSPSLHVIQHNAFKLCRWDSAAAQCCHYHPTARRSLVWLEIMNAWMADVGVLLQQQSTVGDCIHVGFQAMCFTCSCLKSL